MENNNSQMDFQGMEKLILSQVNDVRTLMKEKLDQEIPPECDEFIARCLRLKDGNLDKVIQLIAAFQATIEDFKSWDATLQPSLYEEFYNSHQILPLVQRDSQGRRVLLFRPHLWDPQKFNFDETVLATWMVGQYLNKEFIDVQRNGFTVIVDVSKFTLQQAWAVKQWRLLSLAKWAQNGVVGRVRGIHVIFAPRIIKAIYGAIKPFLKDKLKSRVFFHDNLHSLHQYFNPNGLPMYLGGELDPNNDEYIDKPFMKDLILQDTYFKEFATNSFPRK